MLAASPALKSALNNGYVVQPLPVLIAEWNHNRFGGISAVDNTPADATSNPYPGEYPISSITDPNRPVQGIVKARTNSVLSRPGSTTYYNRPKTKSYYMEEGSFTTEDYSDAPLNARWYTVGEDSPYKYWASPSASNATPIVSTSTYGFPAGSEIQPYVIYKVASLTNKIVIGFETSWSTPVDYDVQVTTNGTTWTTVAGDIAPDNNGRVILYRQSNGTYTTTVTRSNAVRILGVRLLVRSVDKPGSRLNLIELSARFEADLTGSLEDWSADLEISDANFLTPLGKCSSNVATVSLFNGDQLFNNDNPSSPYYKLIDSNIYMTLDLVYDLGAGVKETVRQFSMYSDTWGGEDTERVSVQLKDYSKFFQEQKMPPMLLENITIGEAVWRMCDSVGFNQFTYDSSSVVQSTSVPYFWVDANAYLWPTFVDLAEATQTAIYFDEYGTLQIKTREAVFDKSVAASWDFDATNDNGKLADIVDASPDYSFESNTVNVDYKNTHVSDWQNGFPVMEAVWQPDSDFVLRASPLTRSMTTSDTRFNIKAADALIWPYSGTCNIDGELIRWDAKEYSYYNKTGTVFAPVITKVWVTTKEQKDNIDKNLSLQELAFKNTFDGAMRIVERGYEWTSPRAHTVGVNGYTTKVMRSIDTSVGNAYGVFNANPQLGTAQMTTDNAHFDTAHWVTAARGVFTDEPPKYYGTKFKIDGAKTGGNRGGTGLVFNIGANESAYFVECIPTNHYSATGVTRREVAQELNFYVRGTDGKITRIAPVTSTGAVMSATGVPVFLALDAWYNLDVAFFVTPGGQHQITVYLNGILHMRLVLGTSALALSGRYGLFNRGGMTTDFEYLYAIDNDVYGTGIDTPDDISSWDYLNGGYTSNQFAKEWTYGWRTANRRVGKKNVTYKQRYNQYFYDEFGSIVREVREMEVNFSKFPVTHSRIYSSNSSQVVVADYTATPFGAKFMIANSSRRNAIANGDDSNSFGADNVVKQQLFIYGRLVIQDEDATETLANGQTQKDQQVNTVINDDDVRRHGTVSVDISNKWIQSKDEAISLGNWITAHWAEGMDNVSINTFGNPLIQIGDVVTVNYPLLNMTKATHSFFVTKVSRSWSDGLETSFTLRRKPS